MITRAPAIAILALLIGSPTIAGQADDDPQWPREFKDDSGSLVIHQPQVESWEGRKTLDCRAAVEIRIAQAAKPWFGVVRCELKTVVSHGSRMVTLSDPKLTEVVFPELTPAMAKATEHVVRKLFPKRGTTIALDRILTNMEREPGTNRTLAFKNDPPKLLLSEVDAVLVDIDGEPMFAKLGTGDIEGVINTESNLFRLGDAFYLLIGKSWVTAPALTGPWSAAASLPPAFRDLPSTQRLAEAKKHVPGEPFEDGPPAVYVAQEPTELIVFYGEPDWKAIPGTKLRFAVNTESDCFKVEGEGTYYVLLSGRWFRTTGGDAPLTYCTTSLPDDFRKIPDNHPAGRVLASTPGTEQADEAVLAAQIPRQARVKRAGTTIEITFDGEPTFKPVIDGVEAAVNTSHHVYRVAGHCYCCTEGVWFESAAPTGPWAVCDRVPDAIYTIPPDSPYFPDTFVFVYDADDDSVDTGYWPGYYGCYPYDDCLCYGTGYWYRYWGRRYYWHWYNHYRPRPSPYRTYGTGRYYDHRSGRFRRAEQVRRHQATRQPTRGVYAGWGATVRPTDMTRKMSTARTRPSGTRRVGGPDLYAGRDGSVYRRRDNGEWDLYKKSGWQARERAEEREHKAKRAAERAEANREKREKREARDREQTRVKNAKRAAQREQRRLERAYRARERGSRVGHYRTYGTSRRIGGFRGGRGRR